MSPLLPGQKPNAQPVKGYAKPDRRAWHLEEAHPISRQGPWIQEPQVLPTAKACSHLPPPTAACNTGVFAEPAVDPIGRDLPNEAAFADCLDGFDDFDWGEFDMECQAACNAVETLQGAELAAPDTLVSDEHDEGQQQEGAEVENDCIAHSLSLHAESHDKVDIREYGSWDEAALAGPESQLLDCKTTNAGIQVHR